MNNSIKDHYNTTDLPWVEEKLHIYIYKSSLTFKEIFRWKKCVKHKFCWLFFFINLKMLMFCGQWGVLPLNRTSKASSGLVISTSTQFITYIQSLESVLRILVWGGLYINHTHIITATSAESRNTKTKHVSTSNFGIQTSNLLNLFKYLAIMMWNLLFEERVG